ncbi:MAG: hypothetical protein HS104_12595 [Polyangiaceae bacterium]|nr:hypothetical protein [Polyangiaceae bacterium]
MSTKSVANEAGGKKRGQARANPTDRQSREWLAVEVADGIGEVRAELRDAFEALTLASSEGCAESHDGHANLALALVRAESMLNAIERTARAELADAALGARPAGAWRAQGLARPEVDANERAAGEEHAHG